MVYCPDQFNFKVTERELEKELFPITEEEQKETDRIKNIQTLLQMVGINVDEKKTLYKVDKALELYKKKKGKFDLKDAAKIIADSERIFFRD